MSGSGGSGLMRAGLVAMAVLAALLGGCAGVGQEKYDLAEEENQELRRRVAALESSNEACESELERLERENSQLSQALEEAESSGPFGGDAPEGVSVGTRGADTVIAVAGDVLFASGRAALRSEAKRSLDRVADVLQSRYSDNTIRVEGYTDTDPIQKSGWKSNEHLSAERALAVEQHLVDRGVSGSRVYAAAFGPAQPKETKQASRRVEIVVLGSGG